MEQRENQPFSGFYGGTDEDQTLLNFIFRCYEEYVLVVSVERKFGEER